MNRWRMIRRRDRDLAGGAAGTAWHWAVAGGGNDQGWNFLTGARFERVQAVLRTGCPPPAPRLRAMPTAVGRGHSDSSPRLFAPVRLHSLQVIEFDGHGRSARLGDGFGLHRLHNLPIRVFGYGDGLGVGGGAARSQQGGGEGEQEAGLLHVVIFGVVCCRRALRPDDDAQRSPLERASRFRGAAPHGAAQPSGGPSQRNGCATYCSRAVSRRQAAG